MIGRIYCLRLPEGKFYIGSTVSSLQDRLWTHMANSKVRTSLLYQHTNTVGWDSVTIECLEEIEVPTRYDLFVLENEYIRLLKDDDCLNSINVFRTEAEKHTSDLKKVRAYHWRNREKRNQQSRDYYYTKKNTIAS